MLGAPKVLLQVQACLLEIWYCIENKKEGTSLFDLTLGSRMKQQFVLYLDVEHST